MFLGSAGAPLSSFSLIRQSALVIVGTTDISPHPPYPPHTNPCYSPNFTYSYLPIFKSSCALFAHRRGDLMVIALFRPLLTITQLLPLLSSDPSRSAVTDVVKVAPLGRVTSIVNQSPENS